MHVNLFEILYNLKCDILNGNLTRTNQLEPCLLIGFRASFKTHWVHVWLQKNFRRDQLLSDIDLLLHRINRLEYRNAY